MPQLIVPIHRVLIVGLFLIWNHAFFFLDGTVKKNDIFTIIELKNIEKVSKRKRRLGLHDVEIQNFYVTQILREIDFGELEVLKLQFFAILGAVSFLKWVISKSAKIHKSQNPCGKNGSFGTSKITNFDFT